MERFSESDCPSCCVPVPVDLMPDGDLVRYADAQVTIAALQKEIATRDSTDSILATRIRELEARLTQRTEQVAALQERVKELEAIKIPDDAFTYCAYCGEKSPVDEHNEDLAAHIKVCPKHPMRDVEAQLTQRTAELEALQRERDQWKEAFERSCDDTAHLKAALDAEREKAKTDKEMYFSTIVDLRTALSQLQALVRELEQPVYVCQGCGRLGRDGLTPAKRVTGEQHG